MSGDHNLYQKKKGSKKGLVDDHRRGLHMQGLGAKGIFC